DDLAYDALRAAVVARDALDDRHLGAFVGDDEDVREDAGARLPGEDPQLDRDLDGRVLRNVNEVPGRKRGVVERDQLVFVEGDRLAEVFLDKLLVLPHGRGKIGYDHAVRGQLVAHPSPRLRRIDLDEEVRLLTTFLRDGLQGAG